MSILHFAVGLYFFYFFSPNLHLIQKSQSKGESITNLHRHHNHHDHRRHIFHTYYYLLCP